MRRREHSVPRLAPTVFCDTSVLFAAVLSATGGSRLLLKLGEAGAIDVWVGPRVLAEVDDVLRRKALMARLLDQARAQVAAAPSQEALQLATGAIDYGPDARVLAEAMGAGVSYLATLDRTHFPDRIEGPLASLLIGPPGACLAWIRDQLRD
jgi:predicted nucleic acid-binding protein